MKILFSFLLSFFFVAALFAQKEAFDLTTYTPPKGWQKDVNKTVTSFTISNQKTNSWCRINLVKSTISKGSIEKDFESEWKELVVKSYKPTEAPTLNDATDAKGWKIKTGAVKFTFNKADALAMLTTMSGFERCVSIIATTNSQEYLKDIETFLTSVELQKPETVSTPATGNNNDNSSVVGTWGISGSDQSGYVVDNGINGYIVRQYCFNANGTYDFYVKTFQYVYEKLLLTREHGTYQISGNTITINPQKSVIEAWSKKNNTDSWGTLLSTQNKALEKATYRFMKHYFSGVKEWSLVLQADKVTQRDGPYTGSTAFSNAWIYSPPCSQCFIKLPN